MTVLATSELHPAALERLVASARVRVAPDAAPATLIREAAAAEVVIARDPVPVQALGGERLRAVIRHGAGLDFIPVSEATEAGILVANVPGVNAQSVAEHVVLVTLALARRLRETGELRTRGWNAARAAVADTIELRGRTAGIIGTGNVGGAVARILRHGFGMTVLGAGRTPERVPGALRACTVDELLGASDVVVLACPLTDETRHLIDAARLSLMRPGALLVNVSRGAVIDDAALLAALADGRVGGAALDVFVEEPLADESPYRSAENVLLTPHVAGITDDSHRNVGLAAAEAALEVLAGRAPAHVVNPEVLPSWTQRAAALGNTA